MLWTTKSPSFTLRRKAFFNILPGIGQQIGNDMDLFPWGITHLIYTAVKISQYSQIIFKLLSTYIFIINKLYIFQEHQKDSRILFMNVTHIDLIIIIWFYKITYFILPNTAGLLLEFKIKNGRRNKFWAKMTVII